MDSVQKPKYTYDTDVYNHIMSSSYFLSIADKLDHLKGFPMFEPVLSDFSNAVFVEKGVWRDWALCFRNSLIVAASPLPSCLAVTCAALDSCRYCGNL